MLTSMTGHDCVLLRADDPLIDMNYITSFTGMTDKWFYKLISEGHFPKPIKLGRSSRWYKSEVCSNESRDQGGAAVLFRISIIS
ncbi:helix-turn-helix transcriptional regulator [Escherichia coli]|uniref:helix-turn-helix transcriptional regulator n=1 Tax=Escherichia coli TaxID=562 RepID=UPI003FD227D8